MILAILLIICANTFSFILMGIDKYKAMNRTHRISESTFHALGICFSSLGILIGMLVFHHKIRKPSFYLAMPILCCIQINRVETNNHH